MSEETVFAIVLGIAFVLFIVIVLPSLRELQEPSLSDSLVFSYSCDQLNETHRKCTQLYREGFGPMVWDYWVVNESVNDTNKSEGVLLDG